MQQQVCASILPLTLTGEPDLALGMLPETLRRSPGRIKPEGTPIKGPSPKISRRDSVERCFNRLKGFRGVATRYEKTATSCEAAVALASSLLWARSV
ncbi:transposase [Streptomyces sp. SID8352]|nr:transposase [Streptomyces sp. SID8352]